MLLTWDMEAILSYTHQEYDLGFLTLDRRNERQWSLALGLGRLETMVHNQICVTHT